MKTLITGVSGFIGFHVIQKQLQRGDCVAGKDNTSESFDPGRRYASLENRIISHDAELWHVPVKSSVVPEYTFIRKPEDSSPGMALPLFTKSIFNNNRIRVLNNGSRFEILPAMMTLRNGLPLFAQGLATSNQHQTPYVYNIENSSRVPLMVCIPAIESRLGKAAEKIKPIQPTIFRVRKPM